MKVAGTALGGRSHPGLSAQPPLTCPHPVCENIDSSPHRCSRRTGYLHRKSLLGGKFFKYNQSPSRDQTSHFLRQVSGKGIWRKTAVTSFPERQRGSPGVLSPNLYLSLACLLHACSETCPDLGVNPQKKFSASSSPFNRVQGS